jgi:hypothetical protein
MNKGLSPEIYIDDAQRIFKKNIFLGHAPPFFKLYDDKSSMT